MFLIFVLPILEERRNSFFVTAITIMKMIASYNRVVHGGLGPGWMFVQEYLLWCFLSYLHISYHNSNINTLI